MAVRRDASRYVSGRPSATTMGLFGLGAPEIAVCLVVAALILGPDKLAGDNSLEGRAIEMICCPLGFLAFLFDGSNVRLCTPFPCIAVLSTQDASILDFFDTWKDEL